MKDYDVLASGKDLSELVYVVFEQYKPLILKKASLYQRCSGGRIQKEDFVSDVYEALYYFLSTIKNDKIKLPLTSQWGG